MASIKLRRISKKFGAVEVFENLSLEIASGEFVVFLGPSGCGKTTLLRMIAGLEELGSGEILIDDARIDQLPPGQRGVAMVFQHYALYPHMNVKENMAFGLRNIGVSSADVDRKVADAARVLEIEPLLARKPAQLSGGQKQRVAIGRAIVKQPKAFLFDEPLSNLDAALRSRTRIELARLHQQMKSTMIFVTHDQVEAMTLATRIVVMNRGRIEQVGSAMEIYRQPASRFVATFIGTPAMNLLPARIEGERDGKTLISIPDGSVVEASAPASRLPPGDGLQIGFRAEHVAAGDQIPGIADVVERLGDRTLVYAKLKDGATIVYEDAGESRVVVGDKVSLSVKPDQIHIFDKDGLAHHAG